MRRRAHGDFPQVGRRARRRSTMTSKTLPSSQRTSLSPGAAGTGNAGRATCRAPVVGDAGLRHAASRPCAANSAPPGAGEEASLVLVRLRLDDERAERPDERLRPRCSAPEEILVDLLRLCRCFSCWRRVKARNPNTSFGIAMRSKSSRSWRAPRSAVQRHWKAGRSLVDLVEVHPVAAVVAARRAEGDLAARESLREDLRDLADAVVLGVCRR